MFSNHSAHAPVLFQYVFDELWWPWKLLEMLLGSAVRGGRKEGKIEKIHGFLRSNVALYQYD